jgi:RNA polymerase sigma-70 factor (ECF subfamily)
MEELNLALLQQGDEREFARLVTLFAPKIYSTCLYIIQNKADAEDLTQDILTVLFLNLPKFKGESKLSTWIYRISSTNVLNTSVIIPAKKEAGSWYLLVLFFT